MFGKSDWKAGINHEKDSQDEKAAVLFICPGFIDLCRCHRGIYYVLYIQRV
jgi:hypothetical protein